MKIKLILDNGDVCIAKAHSKDRIADLLVQHDLINRRTSYSAISTLNEKPLPIKVLHFDQELNITKSLDTFNLKHMDQLRVQNAVRNGASIGHILSKSPEYSPEPVTEVVKKQRMQRLFQDIIDAQIARADTLDRLMKNLAEEMLFITGALNGTPVNIFVDSGATYSIISDSVVSQCKVRHLVDDRTSVSIYGVGQERTVGKIHTAPLLIADAPITISFLVMKSELKHVLLGVDFLSPYQCKIDLIGNKLINGTLGKSVPFLTGEDYPLKQGIIDLYTQLGPAKQSSEYQGFSSTGYSLASSMGNASSAQNEHSRSLNEAATKRPSTLGLAGGVKISTFPNFKTVQASKTADVGAKKVEEQVVSDAAVDRMAQATGFNREQVAQALVASFGNEGNALAILEAMNAQN